MLEAENTFDECDDACSSLVRLSARSVWVREWISTFYVILRRID